MNNHPWYQHCIRDIDSAVASKRKRLNDWEIRFLANIRERVSKGISLTDKQEQGLYKLYERCTDLRRIKY